MPRKAKPPSLPGLDELKKAKDSLDELSQVGLKCVPGYAHGIILGLLLGLPAERRERIAQLVDAVIREGVGIEFTRGRDAAREFALKKLVKYDPRRGKGHSSTMLKIHAKIAWRYLGGFPFQSRDKEAWLRRNLPALLEEMKHWACDEYCRQRTKSPGAEELEQIADSPGVFELVTAVLAYHHNLSEETVVRKLRSRQQ